MAFAGSVVLTYLVRKWALKIGFTDQPGHRKIHRQPIALGGGIAIFWTVALPLLLLVIVTMLFSRHSPPQWLPQAIGQHIAGLRQRVPQILILLAGTTGLHILGLIDDRRQLGPKIKLLVQLLVATGLVLGAHIRFDFFIANGVISGILSIIWIVMIVNAFNFLDNMDGLSAGIAVIAGMIILWAAVNSGQVFVSGLLALVCGALLGFLLFNFNPASIFMGDSGSLLVGLFMAVATIRTTYYQPGTAPNSAGGVWFVTLMPLIVLAVPLYDFTSVTFLRLMQGKSPFVGDTQHFSHRLVKRGMTQRQAVLTIYLATACTGLGAAILPQVSLTGMVLIFIQTLLTVLIIAILEKPTDYQDR